MDKVGASYICSRIFAVSSISSFFLLDVHIYSPQYTLTPYYSFFFFFFGFEKKLKRRKLTWVGRRLFYILCGNLENIFTSQPNDYYILYYVVANSNEKEEKKKWIIRKLRAHSAKIESFTFTEKWIRRNHFFTFTHTAYTCCSNEQN